MNPRAELAKLVETIEGAERRRYRQVKLIGEGGHAYTFRAADTKNQERAVAIKVGKSGTSCDIVEEGMRAALLCPHDNIVQVHGWLRLDAQRRCLVMEYVEGGNLRDMLGRLRGDLDRSLEIAIGICRALKKAHENPDPIVHRDVKPENVLIAPNGAPKLTDFGIAAEPTTVASEIEGSLYYLAPEYLQDKGRIDPRADLYSLSAVLYEMLEGHPPFCADSTSSLLDQIRTQAPPAMRADLPAALKRILFRGLQKKPEARYTSARDMLWEMELFQGYHRSVFRAVERFETELSQRAADLQDRTHRFLFLADQYIELASDTLAGIVPDVPEGTERESLEFKASLLAATLIDGAPGDLQGRVRMLLAVPLTVPQPEVRAAAMPAATPVPPFRSPEPELPDGTDQRMAGIERLLQDQQIDEGLRELGSFLDDWGPVSGSRRAAELLYQTAMFVEAIAVCDRALERFSGDAVLLGVRGKALFSCHRKEEALRELRRAVEAGSGDEEVKDLLKHLA
jgi:hypothetical protein